MDIREKKRREEKRREKKTRQNETRREAKRREETRSEEKRRDEEIREGTRRDAKNTDTKQKSYEIYIINNQASLAYNKDGVTIFDYIDFKLKNVSDEEYFFENKNNDEKLFAKIVINRIKGTALVSHDRDKMALTSLTELVYLKNCKLNNNKPKF